VNRNPISDDLMTGVTDERDLMAHPKVGASWEGFGMDCVLRAIGKDAGSVYFWATHGGAELDLFWQEKGKNWGVEFKLADAPSITHSARIAVHDLGLEHLWIVYPGKKAYPLDERFSVLPLRDMPDPWIY